LLLTKAISHSKGTIIDGRFRLEAIIGEGGMGVVWEATYLGTGARCALKIVCLRRPASATGEDAFPAEARVSFRHPHVVPVEDCFRPDGDPDWVIVRMPLLRGGTLRRALEEKRRAGRGPLPLREAATLVLQIVSGVGTAHEHGIVHRDVKPDNVYLHRADEGGEPVAMVLDFGIAKFLGPRAFAQARVTRTGALMGTLGYASPEQLEGSKDVGCAADIWAIGAILFECLIGELPFPQDNPIQLYDACARPLDALSATSCLLPDELRLLLVRMLAWAPDRRPTAREVFAGLAPFSCRRVAEIAGPAPAADATSEDADTLAPTVAGLVSTHRLPSRATPVLDAARSTSAPPPPAPFPKGSHAPRALSGGVLGATLGVSALGLVAHTASHGPPQVLAAPPPPASAVEPRGREGVTAPAERSGGDDLTRTPEPASLSPERPRAARWEGPRPSSPTPSVRRASAALPPTAAPSTAVADTAPAALSRMANPTVETTMPASSAAGSRPAEVPGSSARSKEDSGPAGAWIPSVGGILRTRSEKSP
jgi:serine/threonine-protein kinase